MQSTNYFQNFKYTLFNGVYLKNLLSRAELKNLDILTSTKTYLPYLIKDGERPEDIARYYYGSTSYFWIILLANNMKNIYEDWPRTQDVFDQYIIDKYGSLDYSKATINHYEDSNGNWIENTGDITTSTGVTIYDYEYNLNEKKRIINLIRAEYKGQLVKEFQSMFQ